MVSAAGGDDGGDLVTLDEWIAWLQARIEEAVHDGAGEDEEVVSLRVRRSPAVGRLVCQDGDRMLYAFTVADLHKLLGRAERKQQARDLAAEAAR